MATLPPNCAPTFPLNSPDEFEEKSLNEIPREGLKATWLNPTLTANSKDNERNNFFMAMLFRLILI